MGGAPSNITVTFDLFPEMSEYPLYTSLDNGTELVYKSSLEQVALYDSLAAVDTHFRWMAEYGINGVVLQRFVNELSPQGESYTRRNEILLACMEAAEKYERVFMVEYDTSGAPEDSWDATVLADWGFLVNELKVASSPMYQHHDGKPVLLLFGIGFSEHPGTPESALSLVASLRSDWGCYYVGHVPTYWRTGDGDGQPGYDQVYAAMDVLSPWLVGRFEDEAGFQRMFNDVFLSDVELTQQRGQGYAPVSSSV